MTYVIAQPCVDVMDRACVEECPVEAIFYEDDVPDEWVEFIDANVAFFDDLGSPGGAAKLGPQDFDPPMVAQLPPQVED